MKIDQPAHHLENVLEISERLPFLGDIVDILLPVGEHPDQDERQSAVIKSFKEALGHYQLPYFAYLRVKTDRAREIVGLPFYTDESGREREIDATGWEGYFVGCRNADRHAMSATDIVRAVATQGVHLRQAILDIGNSHYDTPGLASHALLQVARGERFDDLEALKEVNKLYGAMLGELRAYVYRHRAAGMCQETLQYVLEVYRRTGVIQVERDAAFERDLKRHVDFHQKTYDAVAHMPDMHCQFRGSTITTTCFLPRPAESSPEGGAFPRCKVNLSPIEREGHKLAFEIGLLGNPVIRATLSLLG